MGEITRLKLRQILLTQSSSELCSLHSALVDKYSLVEELLNKDKGLLERAMWDALGWKFNIVKEVK